MRLTCFMRSCCVVLPTVLTVLVAVPAAESAIGDHSWSGGFSAACGASSVDGTGHVASAGTFFSAVDFGGGTLTPVNFFSGDVFLARFDGSGNHV